MYDKLKRRTLMDQVGQGAVKNMERTLGHVGHQQQPAMYDMTGAGPMNSHMQPNPNAPLSIRKHRNMVEPDFRMTGARIGNIHHRGNSPRARNRSNGGSSGGTLSPNPRFNQLPPIYPPGGGQYGTFGL